MRNRAQLSIAAFSEFGRPSEGIAPYPLSTAVAVLAAERDRLASSRRRRAIAKLAASRLGDPTIDCLLKQLGADTDALARALAAVPLDRVGRETAAYNLLADKLQVKNCKTKDLSVHVIPGNPSFTITSEIWVDRPRDKIAKILDPQSWDQCSVFWRPPLGTFLIDLTEGGQLPGGTPAEGTPEKVGEPYQSLPRVLFEDFRCVNDICSIEAYLSVWTYNSGNTSAKAYNVWYNLRAQKSGTFGPFPVELATDFGQLTAVDDSGGTRVSTSKTLRYKDTVTTEVSEAATAQYLELGDQLAEMVCCAAFD